MGFIRRLFGRGDKPSRSGLSSPPASPPPSEQYLFSLVDDIQAKESTQGYDSLRPEERVFYCVWTLEAEVNNGGFSQFYFNCSGDIATKVPDALRSIGATHTASIAERANAVFGADGPSVDCVERQARLEELGDAASAELEVFDQEFLEYREDLSRLLAEYMKAARGDV